MYRLVFEDGDNQHQVDENSGLLDIKLSSEKLSIANHFLIEPLRLNISLIEDTWLIENLIDSETMNYIKVKLYNDTELVYTGYLKKEGISLSYPEKIFKVVSYSNLQLLQEFGDMPLKGNVDEIMRVSLSEVCSELSQHILSKTGISFNFIEGYEALNLPREIMLNTAYVQSLPNPGNPNVDTGYTETYSVIKGFKIGENEIIYDYFKYTIKYVPEIDLGNVIVEAKYIAKASATRRKFHNKICEIVEEDNRSKTTSSRDKAEEALDDYIATDIAELEPNLNDIGSISNYSLQTPNQFNPIGVPKLIYYVGNIIPELLSLNKDATALDAIKIFSVLFNVSILPEKNGDLKIANNHFSGGVSHGNVTNKCVAFKLNKVMGTIPEFSGLDKLMGDTSILKNELVDYYTEYVNGSLSAEFELISDTEINIFDTVEIEGNEYKIIELQRSLSSEICKFKGMRV